MLGPNWYPLYAVNVRKSILVNESIQFAILRNDQSNRIVVGFRGTIGNA